MHNSWLAQSGRLWWLGLNHCMHFALLVIWALEKWREEGVWLTSDAVVSVAVFSVCAGWGQRGAEQSAADADSLQPSSAGAAARFRRHGSGQDWWSAVCLRFQPLTLLLPVFVIGVLLIIALPFFPVSVKCLAGNVHLFAFWSSASQLLLRSNSLRWCWLVVSDRGGTLQR